jgi:tetratricopeptide (TPR) repeat protein
LKEALEYYRLAEGNENERMTIFIIGNIAQLALDRGDLDTAHTLSESILPAATRHDDRERMGHLLDVLGGVARRRSNLQKAKGYFEEALEHMEKVARRDEVADISLELADVEIEMGEVQTARRRLTKAMDEYQRLDILHKAHDVESLLDRLASKKESTNGR